MTAAAQPTAAAESRPRSAEDLRKARDRFLKEAKELEEKIVPLDQERGRLRLSDDPKARKKLAELSDRKHKARRDAEIARLAAKEAETEIRKAEERERAEAEQAKRRKLDAVSRERLAIAQRIDAKLAELVEDFEALERLRLDLDRHARALGHDSGVANRAYSAAWSCLRWAFLSRDLFVRRFEHAGLNDRCTLEEAERSNVGRFLLDETERESR